MCIRDSFRSKSKTQTGWSFPAASKMVFIIRFNWRRCRTSNVFSTRISLWYTS